MTHFVIIDRTFCDVAIMQTNYYKKQSILIQKLLLNFKSKYDILL